MSLKPETPPLKVLVLGGLAKSLVNFRLELLRALTASGASVVACAAEDDPAVVAKLDSLGIRYTAVPLERSGLNPFADRRYLAALRALMAREQPDVVLAYTHKPVLYSALAAGGLPRPPRVYPLITGLGFAFMDGGGWRRLLAKRMLIALYKRASRHFTGVFFQNPDDAALFRNLDLVRPETPVKIVRGSGIDLARFPSVPLGTENRKTGEPDDRNSGSPEDRMTGTPELRPSAPPPSVPPSSGSPPSVPPSLRPSGPPALWPSVPPDLRPSARSPRFLLIARLLADKGIREYVEAARRVRREFPEAQFHLVGPTDPSPVCIPLSEVESWVAEGVVVYHGSQADVRPFLRDCSVYVLPSNYGEGTPRTVLEGMATGRAVITTDAPGCRETIFAAGPADAERVREGENGCLVPVKSVEPLVAAMLRHLRDPALTLRQGEAGRRLAEEHYDVHKVNQGMLQFMGLV